MTSFVKVIRGLFGRLRVRPVRRSTMEDQEQPLEMMDQLMADCTSLRVQLRESRDQTAKEKVVFEYLEKTKQLHDPVDDFPKCDWFNVTESLSLDGNLQGKVVVLDFFTYCCINCMHILPDLAKLEEEFPVEKGLVVVGVHSAKFANEKESKNILAAAQRYNIAHPVINDSQFKMWKNLNVHCWPTLLILGPNKNPLFVLTGEGHGDLLQLFVGATLKYYGKEIKDHSLPIFPSNEMLKGQLLKFPAKITSNSKGSLAISDSGNHRIIIVSKNGTVLEEIGGTGPGFKDGSFKECRFNSPQGLCHYGSDEEIIFVADTENHSIRKINLKEKTVATIVGTGKQGNDYEGGLAKDQPISSPWDVVVHRTSDGKELIIIAMAGTHQIWAFFLDDCTLWRGKQYKQGQCAAVAGSGREENRNNSYPNNAAFAQPSGLTLDVTRQEMFLADSESSAIRKIVLGDGKVQAVVGGDRNPQNLFAFGDVDGQLVNAKLQHPLGVCYNHKDKMVYVADTYNHKIKRIDPETSTIETLVIKEKDTGEEFHFNEPGGLCVDETGELLIVANTNNHSIDLIDLKTLTGSSLELRSNDEMDKTQADLICPRITGAVNGTVNISFEIKLKEGIHFTEGAPQKCVSTLEGSVEKQEKVVVENEKVNFEWKLPGNSGQEKLIFKVRLSLCENDLCFPKIFTIECPVEVNSKEGGDVVKQEFILVVDKNSVKM